MAVLPRHHRGALRNHQIFEFFSYRLTSLTRFGGAKEPRIQKIPFIRDTILIKSRTIFLIPQP